MKYLLLICIYLAISTICVSATDWSESKPLLRGKVNSKAIPSMIMVYWNDGNTMSDPITPDSCGLFSFSPQFIGDSLCVTIICPSNIYGVFLQKDKTSELEINGEGVTYSGDNADINIFYNAFQQGFNDSILKNGKGRQFEYTQVKSELDSRSLSIRELLEKIDDSKLKKTFSSLIDKYYLFYLYKLNLMNGTLPESEEMVTMKEKLDKWAKVVKNGDLLPSNPVLISPDGKRTTLFDQLNGKIVYIDLWATWCGPCCREIPYLEKVVAHYKNSDKIAFISISQDEEFDIWQAKIESDKPDWLNFVLEKESGRKFLDAIRCSTIPRFLLIGSDGHLINVRAPRPSSEKIIEVLDNAILKYNS